MTFVPFPMWKICQFWQKLQAAGVSPTGLGARDTLRLEDGMNLYGSDMDETVTPLEAALGWTVAWEPADRDFIGRAALEKQRAEGASHKLVGLVLEGKGVLRNHQKIIAGGAGEGEVTSGSFSPTLQRAIAFARIPGDAAGDCEVDIRGKRLPVRIELMDYRDLTGSYDKAVSVGMFEHVGPKNYPTYFDMVGRVLKDDGLFLLHTIGGNLSSTTGEPWTDKYIFPNGMLPSIAQLGAAMEGLFIMEDWHNFGPHYDKTLMAFMYGPLVLAGKLAAANETPDQPAARAHAG